MFKDYNSNKQSQNRSMKDRKSTRSTSTKTTRILLSDLRPKRSQVLAILIFVLLAGSSGTQRERLRTGDEWKTAFNAPEGHFEYLIMPFGLSNAPSVFQSFMHDIFREYLDKFLIVYLDDILVFSDDWESHVKQVRMVFQVLRANSLFVKGSKCLFGVQKVSFLGFIFSPSTIEMDPVKVQAIYDWTQPTSVKSLQKFLGFANFYRRFISNFSSVAKPLTDLTKKGADVVNWSSATVEAFQELKRRFSSAPVLCQPDVSLPFQVEVDAYEIGAGAVLSQRSSDGSVMKPCAFFSRKFSPAERNYDVGNRELLAMKWAFEKCCHWLEGAKHRVVVLTDHKNLTYLESAKRLNPRQARWSLFFSRFDFVVSYLPGSKNVKADALSRSFVPDSPGVPEPAGILKEGLAYLFSRACWKLWDAEGVPPCHIWVVQDTGVDMDIQGLCSSKDNLVINVQKIQDLVVQKPMLEPRIPIPDLFYGDRAKFVNFKNNCKLFLALKPRSSGDPVQQGQDEIEVYCQKFRKWSVLTQWNEGALAAIFRKGLSEALKDVMVGFPMPAGLNESMSLAIQIGRRLRERKSVHHLAVLPELKPEPMQCDRTLTRVERQEHRRLNGLCFYCGDSTHAISDCPKRTKRFARSATIGTVQSKFLLSVTLICSLSSYSVMAFVDSGAALNLMDLEYARHCGFFLEPLQCPIPLRGIDATPLAKNKPQYWTQLTMCMAPAHQEVIRFLVLHNLHDVVVLGLPWLQVHNPVLDWKSMSVSSWGCQGVHGDVPFLTISSSTPSEVPEFLSDYRDVFDEPKSDTLPPHRDCDCAIDLIPGSKFPRDPPPQRQYKLPPESIESMSKIIQELLKQGVIRKANSYVDDILLSTEDKESHVLLLKELFELLHDAGLKLNTKKVKLMQTEVRDFIENFADKARPLYDILKGENSDFFGPWGDEQQTSFEQLKMNLQTAPALSTVDPLAPFALQVHTSETSVSAVLLQLQGEEWRILGYFSKLLSPVERGFETCARHLVGLYFAVKATEHIVEFNKITLQTPHSTLKLLFENNIPDRLAKEAALTGKEVFQPETIELLAVQRTDTHIPSFAEEQEKDTSLVASRVDPKPPFVCENGVLCHDLNGELRSVVPKHLQAEFTKYNHESLGHLGQQKLLDILREKFYWEKMEETVQSIVQSCLICAQINPRPKGQKPPLLRIAPADGPWSTLQIDYIDATWVKSLLINGSLISGYSEDILHHGTNTSEVNEPFKRTLHSRKPRGSSLQSLIDEDIPDNSVDITGNICMGYGVKCCIELHFIHDTNITLHAITGPKTGFIQLQGDYVHNNKTGTWECNPTDVLYWNIEIRGEEKAVWSGNITNDMITKGKVGTSKTDIWLKTQLFGKTLDPSLLTITEGDEDWVKTWNFQITREPVQVQVSVIFTVTNTITPEIIFGKLFKWSNKCYTQRSIRKYNPSPKDSGRYQCCVLTKNNYKKCKDVNTRFQPSTPFQINQFQSKSLLRDGVFMTMIWTFNISKRGVLEGILGGLGTVGSLINTMDIHTLKSDLENIGYIGGKGVKIQKSLNQVLEKMVLNTAAVLGSSVSHLQDATLALIESEQESQVAKTCLEIQIEYSTNLKMIAQALQSGITPLGLMRNLPKEYNFALNHTDLWVNKWLGCEQNICVGTSLIPVSGREENLVPIPVLGIPVSHTQLLYYQLQYTDFAFDGTNTEQLDISSCLNFVSKVMIKSFIIHVSIIIPHVMPELRMYTRHDLVTPISANKICFQVMTEKVVSAYFSSCVHAENLTIGLYCIEGHVKTLSKKEGSINITLIGSRKILPIQFNLSQINIFPWNMWTNEIKKDKGLLNLLTKQLKEAEIVFRHEQGNLNDIEHEWTSMSGASWWRNLGKSVTSWSQSSAKMAAGNVLSNPIVIIFIIVCCV
ncbi:unnamed protein product [Ranitomeya imitator]|uniref:Gypsy retrotransposon integrase-like protein 1 n=1 Tax=Ranitomeya imitator TaxID=111125 RepID=A0ABN9MH91_9NEOB|nr:unnamed protein product [Ranitomeya imitator]